MTLGKTTLLIVTTALMGALTCPAPAVSETCAVEEQQRPAAEIHRPKD